MRGLCVLALAVATTAQAGYAPPGDIEAAMQAAAVEAKAHVDEYAIIAGLQRARAALAGEPLAAEAQMLQLLIRLRDIDQPQPQTRAAVAALRGHAALTVTDPVDPEQRGLRRPAFAIAGTARALLQAWERVEAKTSPVPTPRPGVLILTDTQSGTGRVPLGYPVPVPRRAPEPGDGFRSHAALSTRLETLAQTHPEITPVTVGRSREQRDIVAWTLGDADDTTPDGRPEPAALISGTLHAREWASPEVVVGLIERYAERADDGGLYRYLLDSLHLVTVPVLNVDGFLHTQNAPSVTLESEAGDTVPPGQPPEYAHFPRDGRLRRKNLRDVDAARCPAPASGCMNGVDLNRNNDSAFFASGNQNSGNPLSLVYHGPSPASEPETLALYAAAALAPRGRLRLYVDVHSFGRVFFGVNTGSARRDAISAALPQHMSAATGHGPGHYPYDATPPDFGIGSTDEYFGFGLQIPAYTLEIEPTINGAVIYGGFGYHHDGFILPDSEIARVRRELADALTLGLYRMTGPPALIAAEIRERDGGRVVYRARWIGDGDRRRLQTDIAGPLAAGSAYRLWLGFDRPMRVRDAQNRALPYAGQTAAAAPRIALEGQAADGGAFVFELDSDAQGWRAAAGGAPDGALRYADDAYALDFVPPQALPLAGARQLGLRVEAEDLSGQALDADPSTPVDWDAGWSGYEDSAGRADTDRGGADRSLRLVDSSAPAPSPAPSPLPTAAPSPQPPASGGGAGIPLGLLAALWLRRRCGRPLR